MRSCSDSDLDDVSRKENSPRMKAPELSMRDPWVVMGRLQKLYERMKIALELKQERKKDELSCLLRLKLKARWRKRTFALVETERPLKWD